MNEEKEERAFRISDKRFSAKKEQGIPPDDKKKGAETAASPEGGSAIGHKEAPGRATSAEEQALPPLNFLTFLLYLSNSALIHLGEISETGGGKIEPNLPLARQTIDILAILKEKTRGNLTTEEEMLLDDLLYDLRMRYVKKANPVS